jgi:hypothetical protein
MRILPLIYVILGAVIAQQHHYFAHLNTFARVASAALAMLLWPLVLGHANLHLK